MLQRRSFLPTLLDAGIPGSVIFHPDKEVIMPSVASEHRQAPELRVPYWIDEEGNPREPLKLSDLGTGYKVLYCFQHWCPGCHATGFPTLKRLIDALRGRGFGFAVVQTVFEGAEENTPQRLQETQSRYSLEVPFGHDTGEGDQPTIMADYRTGGTPWFIVIDPSGRIIHSDFRVDADAVIALATKGEPEGRAAPDGQALNWKQVVTWAKRGNPAPPRRDERSDSAWRSFLTPEQYRIARAKGTERAFSSEMCGLFEPGRYHCVCCDTPLFDAGNKFDSRSGWPSFTQPLNSGVVGYHLDTSHGMQRVETTCNVCDAHLGHVFQDGPEPTGLRYCINAVSLKKAGHAVA